jgi:LPS O-antigen subunit length determinant protein (WzzB/FepE family)
MAVTKAVLLNLLVLALFMSPDAAMAQRSVASGYIEDRTNQLQQTLIELTHRIDQLRRQNQQLEQQLEKMQASYEQRLERLEKAAAAKAPPVRKGQPRP